MAGKKPTMRENISSRPTDKYGNRATDADLGIGPGVAALRRAAAKEITKREGTTSPAGGRAAKAPSGMGAKTNREITILRMAPPSKPAKAPAVKMPAKPQIIRTTTNMKPTPMGKKR
jgi:hypothetical protein